MASLRYLRCPCCGKVAREEEAAERFHGDWTFEALVQTLGGSLPGKRRSGKMAWKPSSLVAGEREMVIAQLEKALQEVRGE